VILTVTIPLQTVSETNTHTHWRARQRRAKLQRETVEAYLWEALALEGHAWPGDVPLTVRLTRVSPRLLDDDNLQGSQKAIRDGVADFLGIDDRDPRVRWRYAQRRGGVREYGVCIAIAPTTGAEEEDA
jgi:hypothetical protein